MKPGARALGVAESYRGRADGERESVLGGVVVRADRVVEDVALSTCTVGGADATAAVCALVASVDREDLSGLLLAGVAPAWFNVVDVGAVHERTGLPTVAVAFEASDGLEGALREHFSGEALEERLARYRSLPDQQPVSVNGRTLYLHAVGVDDEAAADLVAGFTPEGGRPEPLRVAREVARGGRRFLERRTDP